MRDFLHCIGPYKGLGVLDGFGVYGSYLHYGLVILLVGGAFLIFLNLWKKGRLDMDEGPKYQMMDDVEEEKMERRGENGNRKA